VTGKWFVRIPCLTHHVWSWFVMLCKTYSCICKTLVNRMMQHTKWPGFLTNPCADSCHLLICICNTTMYISKQADSTPVFLPIKCWIMLSNLASQKVYKEPILHLKYKFFPLESLFSNCVRLRKTSAGPLWLPWRHIVYISLCDCTSPNSEGWSYSEAYRIILKWYSIIRGWLYIIVHLF
jgi:hypothetical protein